MTVTTEREGQAFRHGAPRRVRPVAGRPPPRGSRAAPRAMLEAKRCRPGGGEHAAARGARERQRAGARARGRADQGPGRGARGCRRARTGAGGRPAPVVAGRRDEARRTPPRGCWRSPPATPRRWSSRPVTRPTRRWPRRAPRPPRSSRPRSTRCTPARRRSTPWPPSSVTSSSGCAPRRCATLEQRRAELDGEVSRLSEYEGQVRTHLVGFFHEQLETLERPGFGGNVVAHPASTHAPS